MYKKHLDTWIVLIVIGIVAYGIALGVAPVATASKEQPPKTLHEAAEAGQIAEVKSFILQGIDVNAKDGGWTALHNAARNGHKEIVKVLLANGAEVNAGGPGYYNRTAAELAMWANHQEVVELLIAKGADVSPLHLAVQMKDQARVTTLVEGEADVNKRTQYGTTPLHLAAQSCDMTIAQLLIAHGANVNVKDNWNWTPLHGAVKESRKEVTELLIAKGANVNAKDGDGWTPLHYAVQGDHRDIAELLLSEQTRPLSGDLAQIALARKRLQQLTNHAAPFEKKLLDIEELLASLNIRDLLSAGQWDTLKGVKIKAVLDEFARQSNEYFIKNPEPQSGDTETRILSMLKNAINEFLEASRIFDESDAAQDDDALFSRMLDVLGKRQELTAQQILARLIKNLFDWQAKDAELESKVAAAEARFVKERDEFSKMGENNYKICRLDEDEPSYLGNGICASGDVNNDGFKDMLFTEYGEENKTGRVFLFFGNKDIDFSSPDMIFEGENDDDFFGDLAATFGDINSDGYDDVLIGAWGYNNRDGRAYIYHGGVEIDNVADIIIDTEAGTQGGFGSQIDTADINNDGYIDILVAAQCYDQGRGRVYLFWGGETIATVADLIFEGEGYPGGEYIVGYRPLTLMVQGWFGRRIDANGDVNGDGYKDILVGARHAQKGSNGAAYLYLGNSKEKMDADCDCVFRGEAARNYMGTSLDLFDIDNDGFDDVVVGARFAKKYRGAIYIWWGGKDFDGNRPADIVLEGEPWSNMGGDDLVCGDFNNDGYGDVLAGAYNYPNETIRHGRAYVFYGNDKTLMDTDCDYIIDPSETHMRLGMSASAGDVNNDGYIDAIIGAIGGKEINGQVFLYFGPFTTEDLQDKIKAQQEVVKEVDQELAQAKRELKDARKSVPSSTDHEKVSVGLPKSIRRFLTPELEQFHDETVTSLKDGSFTQRDETRINAIAAADSQLFPYINELRQAVETLESLENKSDQQQEELKRLKEKLAWFADVPLI